MAWQRDAKRFLARRLYPLETYTPRQMRPPARVLDVPSAWKGLELIIEDILDRFDIGRESCIEFGTEFGYSAVALSNYFRHVRGVDTFTGDIHSGRKSDHFAATAQALAGFPNIELVQADYRDYIRTHDERYDLAHVDIVHTYADTYACGLWAVWHSRCCLFHDTESFPSVRRAVYALARDTGKRVFNYPKCHGLGIIVCRKIPRGFK